MKPVTTPWRITLASIVLFATSCVSEPNTTGDATGQQAEAPTTAIDESASDSVDGNADSDSSTTNSVPSAKEADGFAALPIREGPRERTTESVPHVQLDAAPVPEVDAELRRRAFAIPGVEDEPSSISLAGARALWISEEVDLARPEILLSGREFAHIHPDGSLHIWLPVERAIEVEEAAWGELHPWVTRDDFWDGVVMVFTPKTLAEVDVVMQLLVEAYNNISGLDLDPVTF